MNFRLSGTLNKFSYVPVYDKTKKEIMISNMLTGKSVDVTDINHGCHNIVN